MITIFNLSGMGIQKITDLNVLLKLFWVNY